MLGQEFSRAVCHDILDFSCSNSRHRGARSGQSWLVDLWVAGREDPRGSGSAWVVQGSKREESVAFAARMTAETGPRTDRRRQIRFCVLAR